MLLRNAVRAVKAVVGEIGIGLSKIGSGGNGTIIHLKSKTPLYNRFFVSDSVKPLQPPIFYRIEQPMLFLSLLKQDFRQLCLGQGGVLFA